MDAAAWMRWPALSHARCVRLCADFPTLPIQALFPSMVFEVLDPSTGSVIRKVQATSAAEVDQALRASEAAFRGWRRVPPAERAEVLVRASALIRSRVEAWAQLMAEEMGKPLGQGRAEAEKCARVCEYYAEHGLAALAREPAASGSHPGYVAFEPLGVILSIMPWNFPFWQVLRFGAPALLAGNAVILKHAPNVPGCAQAVEDLFREAGAPAGLFRTLHLDVPATEALIERPEIRAVTLTGSTRAGRAVAARAGAALKKTVLELGGSDPYLILEDADLEMAVEACAASRMNNSGQSCIAAKRLLVVPEIREAFEAALVERLRACRMGDPREEGVQIGPLARQDLRDELHRQVVASINGGARLVLGGELPDGPGWFYPPTLLTDPARGTPAWEDELFGPVAVIISVRDEAEAIRVANGSAYGLGGGVFTADRERGERIARDELEVGLAFVNDCVSSDPRLPFGGIKDSGYGRELGAFGIREFVNVKTLVVR